MPTKFWDFEVLTNDVYKEDPVNFTYCFGPDFMITSNGCFFFVFSFCGSVVNLLHFIGAWFLLRDQSLWWLSLGIQNLWRFCAHLVLVSLYQNSCNGKEPLKESKSLSHNKEWWPEKAHNTELIPVQLRATWIVLEGFAFFVDLRWLCLVNSMKTSPHSRVLFYIRVNVLKNNAWNISCDSLEYVRKLVMSSPHSMVQIQISLVFW